MFLEIMFSVTLVRMKGLLRSVLHIKKFKAGEWGGLQNGSADSSLPGAAWRD